MNSQKVLFQALEFANWAHRNQKRKLADAPYVVHPFHGMVLLFSHGISSESSDGLTVLIAEVLHDTLEDNPEEVTLGLIEEKFGPDVARTVNGVTLNSDNPDKRSSRKKIVASDWRIRIVKVADVLSNTIATTDSIRQYGLAEVQKRFRQPIAERVQMEREFLDAVLKPDDQYDPLLQIHKSALKALDELETDLQKQ